jgi:GrpB-like predicted nucleotidyltransferase (UPF0157 family)
MAKNLSDMTNEKLWHLFPIMLVPYNPKWKTDYHEEEKALVRALGKDIVRRINHIGSTSVEGLMAKPTIDTLLEINYGPGERRFIASTLKSMGYITEGDMNKTPLSMVYMKGYTKKGFADKVFHLHLREPGDHSELYFRDYLKDHLDVQKTYETLKVNLKEKYTHHRDNYTEGKTEFINKYTALAKEKYMHKYQIKEM